MRRSAALAACLVLTVVMPAVAQPPKVCKQDLRTHCPDVRPGGGRLLQCLESKRSALSPNCQQALASVTPRPDMKKRRARVRACRGDLQKFCKDIAKRSGAGVACLARHEKELSEGCQRALAQP